MATMANQRSRYKRLHWAGFRDSSCWRWYTRNLTLRTRWICLILCIYRSHLAQKIMCYNIVVNLYWLWVLLYFRDIFFSEPIVFWYRSGFTWIHNITIQTKTCWKDFPINCLVSTLSRGSVTYPWWNNIGLIYSMLHVYWHVCIIYI